MTNGERKKKKRKREEETTASLSTLLLTNFHNLLQAFITFLIDLYAGWLEKSCLN